MASLRQKPGTAFWWACFTDADGKKRQKSTHDTRRREAQKIADAYEAAAQRRMTVAHVQRTLRDLMNDATGTPMPGTTVNEYVRDWMSRRGVENAPATVNFYNTASRQFLQWCAGNLPHGGKTQMAMVQRSHIDGFRAWLLSEVSVVTTNHVMRWVKQMFNSAVGNVLMESPCQTIRAVRSQVERVASDESRPFTLDEVKKLLSLPGLDDEWRSMILFGCFTGQRLSDLVSLTWRNIDLDRCELSFRSRKTNKQMRLPLALPLVTRLAEVPRLERLGPLHPRLSAVLTQAKGDPSGISRQFYRLLSKVDLVPKVTARAKPEPGTRRRNRSDVSFHSFRHTATTFLTLSGAPEAVSMEFIGHTSKIVHHSYSHVGMDALRRAVSLLPTL